MNTCERVIVIKDPFNQHKYICGKNATHFINGQHLCRHHSKTGRYVVRNGDVGEIIARFDTEEDLRKNIHFYPGMIMQKLTKSHRKQIF